MITNLNEIAKEHHQRMVEKGFYEQKREIGTLLMLIVSELSEALEADRKNKHSDLNDFMFADSSQKKENFEKFIKDTFEDEIADTFIRLLDLCGYLDIDIDEHIKQKMWYNSTRPNKHGKAY